MGGGNLLNQRMGELKRESLDMKTTREGLGNPGQTESHAHGQLTAKG